ncbi:MAG: MFS transporter [Raoultibacter sp.]
MTAQIITTSDNAVLGIAVQELMGALNASYSDIQQANMIYSLIAGSSMVASGLIGIIVGWRRTFQAGLLLAAVGEVVIMFAPNMMVLTWVGRVFVGLGSGLAIPSVLGLIPALYQGKNRAIAFGAISGAYALSTLAPIPFGILLDAAGFRVTFGALAVLFVIAFAGAIVLPKKEPAKKKLKLDAGGIVLSTLGLTFFLFGISRISTWGIIAPLPAAPLHVFGISPALPLAAVGAILLVILFITERKFEVKHGNALLPRSFTQTAAVRAALLAVVVPYFFMGAQGIIMTPYIQLVAHFTATQTGMLALLSGVPMFLFAMGLPKFFPQLNPRKVIQSGFAIIAIGAVLMALGCNPQGVSLPLYVGTVFAGSGVGVVNSQSNNAVATAIAKTSARDAQQSGGIQGFSRNFGLALGASIMGTLLLVSVNLSMPVKLAEGGVVSQETITAIEKKNLSFASDEQFIASMNDIDADEAELQGMISANQNARQDATRYTMLALAGTIVICLIGTRHIANKEREETAVACGRVESLELTRASQ